MTYYEALRRAQQKMSEAGIADAAVDAWILFELVTGMNRTRFLLDRSGQMEETLRVQYEALTAKRCSHIPLQHLTGEQAFMGLVFHVNEDVLIPRQDTEVLVEKALECIHPGMKILDMCTGSGCIAISLAVLGKECLRKNRSEAPGMQVDAADVSLEALSVAERNNDLHCADVHLIHSDLFTAVTDSYDMIVSNPPYIPTAVIDGLSEEVRLHEPHLALDGAEDGLFFYRKIINESSSYLNADGWLLFEIGYDQGSTVSELMRASGFEDVEIIKDLAGLDRVVLGRK